MILRLAVIGGMGPDAGVDFLFTYLMPAFKRALGDSYRDQAVPSFRLLSDPFGDRTAALLEEAKGNPALARQVFEQLQEVLTQAANMGCTHVCLVCNTVHAFIDGLTSCGALDLRGMHLLDIRVAALAAVPSNATVALMATRGTIESGLYARKCERRIVLPDESFIELTMDGIYAGVKAGNLDLAEHRFALVAQHLAAKGASHVILGCTEIPLVLKQFPGLTLIDPNRELAKRATEALIG